MQNPQEGIQKLRGRIQGGDRAMSAGWMSIIPFQMELASS